MYNILDVVVYPGYGVAEITKEIKKNIQGEEISFFELNFKNKDIKILIPKNGFESIGIRKISTISFLEEKIGIIASLEDNYHGFEFQNFLMISWNRRSKEYQNRIRRGDFFDLCSISREISLIGNYKELSFGEKNVLNQVDFLISEEYSIVYNKDIEMSKKELKLIFCSSFKQIKNKKNVVDENSKEEGFLKGGDSF